MHRTAFYHQTYSIKLHVMFDNFDLTLDNTVYQQPILTFLTKHAYINIQLEAERETEVFLNITYVCV